MKKNILSFIIITISYVLLFQNCGSSGGGSGSSDVVHVPIAVNLKAIQANDDLSVTLSWKKEALYSYKLERSIGGKVGTEVSLKSASSGDTYTIFEHGMDATVSYTVTATHDNVASDVTTATVNITFAKIPVTVNQHFGNLGATLKWKNHDFLSYKLERINNKVPTKIILKSTTSDNYSIIEHGIDITTGYKLTTSFSSSSDLASTLYSEIISTVDIAFGKLNITATADFTSTSQYNIKLSWFDIPEVSPFTNLYYYKENECKNAEINSCAKLAANLNGNFELSSLETKYDYYYEIHSIVNEQKTMTYFSSDMVDVSAMAIDIGSIRSPKDHSTFLSSSSDVDWFKVVVETNGIYIINSYTNFDTVGAIHTEKQLSCNDTTGDDDGINMNFKFETYLTLNTPYYLCITGKNSAAGDYRVQIEKKASSTNDSFIYYDDDSVLERATSLIWQRKDWKKDEVKDDKSWWAAVEYCNNLTLAGTGNWTLPTKDELLILAGRDSSHRSKFTKYIEVSNTGIETEKDWYWSSTEDETNNLFAYEVKFQTVSNNSVDKTNRFRRARCVNRP